MKKPGVSQSYVELLKLLVCACVGSAVIMAVVWVFYQLLVAVEALT